MAIKRLTKKLNSKQVVHLLLKDDGNRITHGREGRVVVDNTNDEIGNLSEMVFCNLIESNKIKYAGKDDCFYNNKYYRLNK